VIESLVRGALAQRLVVAVIATVLLFFGLDAARKLSVDAFPDVTNIQVQIATEAPGVRRKKLSVLPPCRWKWR